VKRRVEPGNLFADAAPPLEGERFETLLSHRNLVIERIVSSDAITPTVSVQLQAEWVVLVCGEAVLEVGGDQIRLESGDHLFLPAGSPHTVHHVSQGAIWLAVHLHPDTEMTRDVSRTDASAADHPPG
jgi:cupin 2 domain-containing protein